MAEGIVMSTQTELVVVPPKETALAVFTAEKGLEPWLQKIRAEVDDFNKVLPELTTQKGRDRYASMAHKIAKSKTALEAVGKELSAQQKEVPKRIDAERKRVWDTLEAWQKEVRKPLDDWQAAEDRRIDAIKADIEKISDHAMHTDGVTVTALEERIARVEAVVIAGKWAEFQVDAELAKEKTLTALYTALTNRKQYEAEQAELVRLREEKEAREKKDNEDRIAREASERATREAEEKARDEKAAAEKREADLKLAAAESERKAEQAKREQLEAEQKAEADRLAAIEGQKAAVEQARLDEIARQQAAADEITRQQKEREADMAHKGAVMRAAKEALIGMNITEELAKAIVLKIARGEVPNVTINF